MKRSLTAHFGLAVIVLTLLDPETLFAQTPDPFVPVKGAAVNGKVVPAGLITPEGQSVTITLNGHSSIQPLSLATGLPWDATSWFPAILPADHSANFNNVPLPSGWEGASGGIAFQRWPWANGLRQNPPVGQDPEGGILPRGLTPNGSVSLPVTLWGNTFFSFYDYVFLQADHVRGQPNGPVLSQPAPAVVASQGNPSPTAGDPVDLSTGLFVLDKTDLMLPDVLPITLTRTYRTMDPAPRVFGIGATHSYDLYLIRNDLCSEVRLILPDGGRIRYLRTAGTNCYNSTLTHTSTPTRFYQSTLTWNATLLRWVVQLKGGTVYRFLAPDLGVETLPPGPATVPVPPPGAMVGEILDRYGNQLTIARDAALRITQITSPNGRTLTFSYDPTHSTRIIQVQDNITRVVGYQYDASGRLWKVTDPELGVTEYTYDAAHRMQTIKDARSIVYLTNTYDPASGRVTDQVLADGTYHFDYTPDANGNITQTDVTDPRTYIRRVTFNAAGYTETDTHALGQPEAQTLTYEWETGTNLLLSVTDNLGAGRKTAFTYFPNGNVHTQTRLAGTAQAVTTTFTYEPQFNQLASVTDPLLHQTTFGYTQGKLTSITNALGQTWTITPDSSGRPLSITSPSPISATTQFGYTGADLTTITNPLTQVTTRVPDGAGRLLSLSNARGDQTSYQYDKLNRLKQILDPENGLTLFDYDPNGNLTRVTDANTHATNYEYDPMDRLWHRTDPLAKVETFGYDPSGNLTDFTDRKSQLTHTVYDPLNRRQGVTYQDGSTTTYTWDKGNRLTQVVDSLSGTITRVYDDLDRLTSETTPQGSVSYVYDDAGRRTSMTVAGQPQVTYTYDDANQLHTITQGSAVVTRDYDEAGRRKTLALPNGVTVGYGYNAASQLTSLTYTKGGATLGNLTYEYDPAGNRTKVGGSWARTGLPQAVTSATYNAANRQGAFDNTTLSYDDNGNLTTAQDAGGSATYGWNARNQMTGITTSNNSLTAGFVYDPLGRRTTKTINGVPTSFLYDGLNPVQEKAGATVTANILPGLNIDEYFTRTDSAGTRTVGPDALGSTLALTDQAGTVTTAYTYEPFGNTSVTGAASTNTLQYTGRENDGTGLYYYRARYYSPRLQRFLSEDPLAGLLEVPDTFNRYPYVLNDPISYRDPSGQIAPVLVGIIAGGAFGGAGAISGALAQGVTPLSDPGTFFALTGLGVANGIVSGALIGGGLPPGIALPAIGAFTSGLNNFIAQSISGRKPINLCSVAGATIGGAVGGAGRLGAQTVLAGVTTVQGTALPVSITNTIGSGLTLATALIPPGVSSLVGGACQ